jgi:hypothetical protein
MESYKEEKMVSWSGKMRFFKSSPVDEYHLPQMNSEKVFLGAASVILKFASSGRRFGPNL